MWHAPQEARVKEYSTEKDKCLLFLVESFSAFVGISIEEPS